MNTLPMPSRYNRALRGRVLALLGAFFLVPLLAQAQKVTADLSQEVTAIGQPVQLNVSVVGGRGARLPDQLNIPGLEVRFVGRSEQVNIVNFQMTSTSVFSYLVVPKQTGDFTIPPISIAIGGRTFRTAPLTLRVGGNSGGVPVMPAIPVQPPGPPGMPSYMQPGAQQSQTNPGGLPAQGTMPAGHQDGDPAFGDLIIPKKSAYVGEVIPVELRFYFSASYPVRLADRPTFSGDGFTVMNFSKPIQSEQQINGENYNVVIFKTAITPVKSGELEVTPATIQAQITMPPSGPPQGGSPDDFFNNFFNGSGFGETRQVTVASKPQKVEVKQLPKEGRPDDFSGAIGQFTLQANATPKKAEAGDPITLSAVVSGRGNFDAIGAPTLMDSENWKSYPPSEKFDPSPKDPIGYNGQKTFDYMIVARQDTTLTPSPEFSFFDPAVEKYVTLKAGPVNVTARGNVGATAPSTAVAAASPTATPVPTQPEATPPPAPTKMLATNFRSASFEPFILTTSFLIVNGVAAAAWFAFLLFGLGRAAANSSLAQRSARRREARRLLQQTDDMSATPEQFYQGAEAFIRARLAPEGSSLDTRELLTRSNLPADTKEKVGVILDRADEGRYSTSGVSLLGADERQSIIKQLKSFDEQLDA